MTDFTSEENQELVETIKGPKYYRIQVNGYGGEGAYMAITKEAHDFWASVTAENGDSDLVQYMITAEDEEPEFDEIGEVPKAAMFMTDEDGDPRPWYEPPNEIEHTFGGTLDSCWLTVDQVEGEEYGSNHVREIIDREDITELNDTLCEEHEIEIIEMGCCEEPECDYIAQMYSSEKGCFYEGVIETVGEFDPKKLKIFTTEYLNGEDTIDRIEYDGVEVDNMGGDTVGKGYYAAVWKN